MQIVWNSHKVSSLIFSEKKNEIRLDIKMINKLRLDILCELPAKQTIHMKCHLISSPEHEVLMVSYCGQSMSVVCRPSFVVRRAVSTIALKHPWTNWLDTW